MNKAIVFLICILAVPAAGAAEMKDYESLKRTDVFRYWLKGVSDGYMTANGFLASDNEQPLFCSPDKLGLNTDNAGDILDNYVRAHAGMAGKLRNVPIEVVYLAAMKDAFSCK